MENIKEDQEWLTDNDVAAADEKLIELMENPKAAKLFVFVDNILRKYLS